tara:strand:+ start:9235 stop:10173 length:939 start_codon:yes stop_codon:yes gene_type:complete
MAFLDNSGDIILDAVLTDTGRARLAKGDGTFRIAKFALGDDEIDYALYDKTNASGSAYYDLQILQTPVLEAFTNNTATMSSKLISISRTNLLYLPSVVLNEVFGGSGDINSSSTARNQTAGVFYVAVDDDTNTALAGVSGVIDGVDGSGGNYVRVDQGLDTDEVSPQRELDSDLVETQYLLEMDTRLGEILSKDGNNLATISFIDDDQIASYYLSLGTDLKFVSEITNNKKISDGAPGQVIKGPRGTSIQFKVQASIDLNTSTFLFSQLGATMATPSGATAGTYLYIDSNIRVTGVTTGNRIDIPARFIKKQ